MSPDSPGSYTPQGDDWWQDAFTGKWHPRVVPKPGRAKAGPSFGNASPPSAPAPQVPSPSQQASDPWAAGTAAIRTAKAEAQDEQAKVESAAADASARARALLPDLDRAIGVLRSQPEPKLLDLVQKGQPTADKKLIPGISAHWKISWSPPVPKGGGPVPGAIFKARHRLSGRSKTVTFDHWEVGGSPDRSERFVPVNPRDRGFGITYLPTGEKRTSHGYLVVPPVGPIAVGGSNAPFPLTLERAVKMGIIRSDYQSRAGRDVFFYSHLTDMGELIDGAIYNIAIYTSRG